MSWRFNECMSSTNNIIRDSSSCMISMNNISHHYFPPYSTIDLRRPGRHIRVEKTKASEDIFCWNWIIDQPYHIGTSLSLPHLCVIDLPYHVTLSSQHITLLSLPTTSYSLHHPTYIRVILLSRLLFSCCSLPYQIHSVTTLLATSECYCS